MESDLIIEEGDRVEEPALPIEHLVPLEQNQRRNRYGSIVCYKSEAEVNIEGDEESNSLRSLELVISEICSFHALHLYVYYVVLIEFFRIVVVQMQEYL